MSNNYFRTMYCLAVLGLGLVTSIGLIFVYLQFNPWPNLSLRPLPYRDNDTQPISESETRPNLNVSQQPPVVNAPEVLLQPTTIPEEAFVHGFTVLDNIYLCNGTFYVVTADPSTFPPRHRLLSVPLFLGPGVVGFEPTDAQLRFVDPVTADEIFGPAIARIDGVSIVVYDPVQFMTHFYHWFGEIILGAWRVYSHIALAQGVAPSALPLPRRVILPFIENDEWRDKAGVDGALMRAAFPMAAIEQAAYWKDLMRLGTTVVFERIVLVSRYTAHTHPFGGVWYKMIAGTMNVTAPPDFWAPVRASMWRNVFGFVPSSGDPDPAGAASGVRPLVTYISRQGGGRRLDERDHLALVQTLRELEADGLCAFHLAAMERMSLRDQIELASRSTILVGVHGNGLTHQLWMPPSVRSTVIEIFVPNGYVFDYELLARNMGHRHYAVWNDTFRTYEEGTYHKATTQLGFTELAIPVHAPTIASIIRTRLSLE
ncbi:hypothetical protein C8J57DRAFT_1177726 [Mycena rebaudengoi]|nr:hypothetical protein C8J57DRAFT_1177726 [Mycena rebaudengoi]